MDSKLLPSKHFTLQQNAENDSDYVLLYEQRIIWISQEMINNNITILNLFDIFDIDLSTDIFKIKFLNYRLNHTFKTPINDNSKNFIEAGYYEFFTLIIILVILQIVM